MFFVTALGPLRGGDLVSSDMCAELEQGRWHLLLDQEIGLGDHHIAHCLNVGTARHRKAAEKDQGPGIRIRTGCLGLVPVLRLVGADGFEPPLSALQVRSGGLGKALALVLAQSAWSPKAACIRRR